jgi:hypothetical protein
MSTQLIAICEKCGRTVKVKNISNSATHSYRKVSAKDCGCGSKSKLTLDISKGRG